MTDGPTEAPRPTTVYTYTLAGETLDALLDAAERDVWPNSQCEREWELLRNWAMQTESFEVDEAESAAWARTMREIGSRQLEYPEWVEARMTALAERVRARKLAQTNLRYKYGFKQPRRWGLVARSVQEFYRAWSGPSD